MRQSVAFMFRTLILSLCVISLSFAVADDATLLIGVNSGAAETIAKSLLPEIFAKVPSLLLSIPDAHTSNDSIDVDITGIKIAGITFADLAVSSTSTLNLNLDGLSVNGSLIWQFREHIWFAIFECSATALMQLFKI